MVHVSIGGMQLKRWTGYFRIIVPTLKVLKAAKATSGCVHADTFKDGKVFFAVSVWETPEQMTNFARSGLHGHLMQTAMDHIAMFYNHSQPFDDVPSRQESVTAWTSGIAARDGRGTVGQFAG